jgi:hypothetical protein
MFRRNGSETLIIGSRATYWWHFHRELIGIYAVVSERGYDSVICREGELRESSELELNVETTRMTSAYGEFSDHDNSPCCPVA